MVLSRTPRIEDIDVAQTVPLHDRRPLVGGHEPGNAMTGSARFKRSSQAPVPSFTHRESSRCRALIRARIGLRIMSGETKRKLTGA